MGEERLGRLARNQWGVFSRAQALEAGTSRWSINRRLRQSEWIEVERDVYRFPGGQPSWYQKVMAVTLSLGPQAVASHRTATFLWGIEGLRSGPPAVIEVTAPFASSRTVSLARVHHTRQPIQKAATRELIPTAPLARSLIDLADIVDEQALFIAFDSACRKFPSLLAELSAELKRTGNGHRASNQLAGLVDRAKGEPHTGSPLEARAALKIDALGLPRPSRQVVMREPNGAYIVRVDFVWLEARVILQCDSHEHHLDPAAFEKDLRQRRKLESLGWRVIHVTWKMLENDEWLRDLARLLESAPTQPGV